MKGNNLDSTFGSIDGTTDKPIAPKLVLYFSVVSLLLAGAAWVFANVFWPEVTLETSAIMIFVSVTTGVSITALAPLISDTRGKSTEIAA